MGTWGRRGRGKGRKRRFRRGRGRGSRKASPNSRQSRRFKAWRKRSKAYLKVHRRGKLSARLRKLKLRGKRHLRKKKISRRARKARRARRGRRWSRYRRKFKRFAKRSKRKNGVASRRIKTYKLRPPKHMHSRKFRTWGRRGRGKGRKRQFGRFRRGRGKGKRRFRRGRRGRKGSRKAINAAARSLRKVVSRRVGRRIKNTAAFIRAFRKAHQAYKAGQCMCPLKAEDSLLGEALVQP